jgi:ABC-type Fe3+-hydroxamate transport system substrate-binding protein
MTVTLLGRSSPIDDATRRQFLIGGISVAALLTGCGGTDPATLALPADGDDFPVTLTDKFGTVTILAAPDAVVSVGRTTDGDKLVAETEAILNKAAAANPSFTGKTLSILLGYGGKLGGYTTADTRMQVATALGFAPSGYTAGLDQTKFFVELSEELVNDADADVVILLTREDLSAADALKQYPAIARSTFATENRLVIVEDPNVSLALSSASVLSIPFAVNGLVPLLTTKLS